MRSPRFRIDSGTNGVRARVFRRRRRVGGDADAVAGRKLREVLPGIETAEDQRLDLVFHRDRIDVVALLHDVFRRGV